MAYTTIDNPKDYFSVNTWTADDSSPRSFTGFGHQPDLLWVKHRGSASINPTIVDSVRGGDKMLSTAGIAAEDTKSHGEVTAFGSDGITVADGTSGSYPKLYFNDLNPFGAGGGEYVCWSWKAGTSFSNDASATGIGSLDSSGSVNETAGFSIVSYTGNSTASTIKHGLSTTPSMIIVKGRIADRNWIVGHQSQGWSKSASMDGTGAFSSQTHWNSTAPTSSVFTIEGGANSNVNTNSAGYIAYCFSERQGYSAFGTYKGNGDNADGAYVYTGFSPAYVMIKRADSTSQWCIVDRKRPGYNIAVNTLFANSGAAEATDLGVNLLSNGFKEDTTNNLGADGGDYVYAAFAESPFVNSNGVPATAV